MNTLPALAAPSSFGPVLPHDVGALLARVHHYESELAERDAAIAKHDTEIAQRDARIEHLQEQIRLLLARRFAPSSEKLPDGQLGLFNEAEAGAAQDCDSAPGHRGRRPPARDAEARPVARCPAAHRRRASVARPRAHLPAPRGRTRTLRRGGERAARRHPRHHPGAAPRARQVPLPALRGPSAHRPDARAAPAQEPRQPRAARPRGHREVRRCPAAVSPAPATPAHRRGPLAHHAGDVDGARRRTRGPCPQPAAR